VTIPPTTDDAIEAAIELLKPYVASIVERINVDEFTTVEFIQAMQLDPPTAAIYEDLIQRWPESNPELAKMVVHGQVIPQVLRRTGLVEWAGYAHGEEDAYAVPAWWVKREPGKALE
jgi:hypothetical protein